MDGMKINILGTEYTIIKQSEEENPKLEGKFGYTEPYSKKIVLDAKLGVPDKEKDSAERQDLFANKVLRHELIHAFFVESGLNDNCDYATNEELVDWIAAQFPRMLEVFNKLEVID